MKKKTKHVIKPANASAGVVLKQIEANRRRSRALKTTLIMALILVAPVAYLAYLKASDPIDDIHDEGAVQEFAFAANDASESFTNYDTQKRVSLILILPAEVCDIACDQALELFTALKKWSDETLLSRQANDIKPQHINFVVMSKGFALTPAKVPQNTKRIQIADSQTFILPSERVRTTEPLLVFISQESRFHGIISTNDDLAEIKAKKILQRLTSETYLFHYLTMQSLMWKKASNYLRGKEEAH